MKNSNSKGRNGGIKVEHLIKEDHANLNHLFRKMDELERKLEQKADRVVSVQVLHHRNEIDELIEKINTLEQKLESLKGLMTTIEKSETEAEIKEIDKSRVKKSWLVSMLSMFGM